MDAHQRLVNGFMELVTIDSPTKHEEEVSKFLKLKLFELGFEISEDNVGEKIGGTTNNLFGFLSGTMPNASTLPTIMLNAHMDCVPPCIGVVPQLIDGVITSKGDTILGSDDKAGIIAILEGVRRLKEQNIPFCNVQVIFSVAEEGGVNGAKHMDKSKIKADLGYVLDVGGSPGTIVYAAPGINQFHIKVKGRAAHAGIEPENGINAIQVLSKALVNFPQGRIDHETTANIGMISGGNASNIVAEHAEVICEIRSINANTLSDLTKDVIELFENTAKENNAEIEVELDEHFNAFNLAQDTLSIKLVQNVIQHIGLEPQLITTGGGSDANIFNAFGLPAIPLGIGMTDVHTTHENITTEHLEQTCQIVMGILSLVDN